MTSCPVSKRKQLILAGAALCLCLLLFAYYTGDQENSVDWSGNFTIDTRDSLSESQPLSSVAGAFSGQFAIDTRDADSTVRPFSVGITSSPYFTIDTRDADSISRAISLLAEESSGFFSIDTRAESPGFMTSAYFTVDTRDPDDVWRGVSQATSETLAFFTIDTRDPPPEDTDNDGLHDIWEQIYFGADLLLTDANADWDGDGYSNFGEFAFGLNPTKPDASPIRQSWVEAGGTEEWFYLRYSRHILAVRMVNYVVERSDEFSGWENISSEIEEVEPIENLDGAVEVITIRYRLPSPRPEGIYFRLRAE